MLTRPESPRSVLVADDATTRTRAPGLIIARIGPESDGDTATIVDELDRGTIDRIRRTALTLRARYAAPITIEARYVEAPDTEALVATLDDLRSRGIYLRRATTVAPESAPSAAAQPKRDDATLPPSDDRVEVPQQTNAAGSIAADARPDQAPKATLQDATAGVDQADAPAPPLVETPPQAGAEPLRDARDERLRDAPEPPPRARARAAFAGASSFASTDPFGVDEEYRRAWLRPLRFLFERYWRVDVSGIENVPLRDGVLVAANHSGAVPADAFMLAVALELHHPARRCLRVLYDKFVDVLPWIGPVYNRLGGVPSSFANAELMLRRGEALAIFPEGIAGVEKRWIDRYQLQPFRSGTARLSLATGAPIVPVAIVGAEEAYPVVARLYRVGRLVGVPWIPVTPFFPLCGLAGAVPLPTKWRMRFCPPIHPPAAVADTEKAVEELTAEVRRSIAHALGEMLLTRRGVFV